MPPPNATPRHGKSVHYEPIPPPPAYFPRPAPYSDRMVAFGLPDLSVPVGYLGPRKVDWPTGTPTPDLAARLQAHEPHARIAAYDLAHVSLAGGGMRTACMLWKLPPRRQAMKRLDLEATNIDDAEAATFAAFLAQAPSAIAPLELEYLSLARNNLWASAFRGVLDAFSSNPHATVRELDWTDAHVGALRDATTTQTTATTTHHHHHHAHHGTTSTGGEESKDDGATGTGGGKDAAAKEHAAMPSSPGATTTTNASATTAAAAAGAGSSVSGEVDMLDENDLSGRTLDPTSPAARLALYHHRASLASALYTPLVAFLAAPHSTLRVLHLGQNGLGDLFLAYLAEGVRHSRTLEDLRLERNALTDHAVRLLALALGGSGEYRTPAELDQEARAARERDGEEDAKTTRSTSRNKSHGTTTTTHGKTNTTSTGKSGGASAAGGSAGKKGGVAIEEEPPVVEVPTSQPLPTFLSSPNGVVVVNTSLRILDLASNQIGVRGGGLLLDACRRHPRLVRVDLAGQSGLGRSDDSSVFARLQREIDAACLVNARRALRATKLELVRGLHRRVGAHSALAVLVHGAKELSASGPVPVAATAMRATKRQQGVATVPSPHFSSSSAASSLGGASFTSASRVSPEPPTTTTTIVHSRTASRVPMPSLPITPVHEENSPTSTSAAARAASSINFEEGEEDAKAQQPHALLLAHALEQVWEYIGYEQS